MSRATELSEQIRDLGPRPAGSDAERRAAVLLCSQIAAGRRTATLETFWSRPNWAVAQAWHVALAVAGSLLGTTQPKAGAAVVFVALVCLVCDWSTCRSPGRLLTRERASQNVVSPAPATARVRLIITANLDTGRLDPDHAGSAPGWLFWIALATVWVLITALAQVEGGRSTALAILQLVPTLALLLSAAGLATVVRAGDNAAGVGAAVALVRALDAAPPANLAVELVISGAGAGYGQGLRRHLRARRHELDATNTVVLGITGDSHLDVKAFDIQVRSGESPKIGVDQRANGAAARPGAYSAARPGAYSAARPGAYFLASDGPLLVLGFFDRLRALAAQAGMTPRQGRGCSPALPGRLRHLPALSIGGDPDAVLNAGLQLVDAVDAYIASLTHIASLPH